MIKHSLLAGTAALLAFGAADAQTDNTARGLAAAALISASPSASTITNLSGISNLSPALLPHLRTAVASAQNGQAQAGPVLFVGDSTMRFTASQVPNGNEWINAVATRLSASGIPTSVDGFFGASNAANLAAYTTFDSRVVGGTGWTIAGQSTAGGKYFVWPGNLTATAFSFTPANAFNQCDIYYLSNTTNLTVNVDRSGTAATVATLNTAAALGSHKVTYNWTGTAVSGTLNLTPTVNTAGSVYVFGEYCRDTAIHRLEFFNMSWAGSNSADWVATTYSPQYDPITLIKLVAPTAIVVGHGINDWNTGTSSGGSVAPTALSTYKANVTSIAAAGQITGDAILTDGPQSNPANYASIATQQTYIATLAGLSSSLNVPFLDRQVVLGGFTAANANSWMFDDRHPNKVGEGVEASAFIKLFSSF